MTAVTHGTLEMHHLPGEILATNRFSATGTVTEEKRLGSIIMAYGIWIITATESMTVRLLIGQLRSDQPVTNRLLETGMAPAKQKSVLN